MLQRVSPTVFREGRYRFFFFSREEPRVHIHVVSPDGEAKFWIEPTVSLAAFEGLSTRQLRLLQTIVEGRKHEIQQAWRRHFGR
jgi:hypothetical protein